LKVRKRSGKFEDHDISKLQNSLKWACEDLPNVSPFDIVVNAELHLYDGISTEEIHKTVTKTAKSMITLKTPEYSEVHAKLLIQELYRNVYKGNEPLHLYKIITNNIKVNKYTEDLINKYSKEEIDYLNTKIIHKRDLNFKSIGIEQLIKKYLLKDKEKNPIYETPQVMFMTLAMAGFIDEKKDRLKYVVDLYDGLSLFKLSLPTPIMANLRTPNKNFSSCALIRRGDTANSWLATDYAIGKLGLADNGIGLAEVDGRSIGSDVGNGKMKHHGFRPIAKVDEALISRSKQGNRNGASTNYFTWWNKEIMDILTLKSPRTEESKRIMFLDYSILFNKFFYRAVQEDREVALFSTKEAPDLLESMVSADQQMFEQTYNRYLEDSNVPKKYIKAREIFKEYISQRNETGRYYAINIDEVNRNSPFKVPIYQSNLCSEILLPTAPLQHPDDTYEINGADVGICVLGNINLVRTKPEEYRKYGRVLNRLLDNTIDLINFALPAAKSSTLNRRSLGMGISNLAHFYAVNDVRYGSKEALDLLDKTMEQITYIFLESSMELAKEKGKAPLFNQSTYADGLLPIDRYNKNVDELVDGSRESLNNWEELRLNIKKYGLRNSTLMSVPPAESSSQISNSTNGIEPVKTLIVRKDNGVDEAVQIVPDYPKLSHQYDLAFDRKMNVDYLKTVAVVQKWIDNSISANTYFNPKLYNDNKIPIAELEESLYFSNYYGIKTLYYETVNSDHEIETEDVCSSGACSV
jgi:ribonucleoside-diphosphate reductase alpha chain